MKPTIKFDGQFWVLKFMSPAWRYTAPTKNEMVKISGPNWAYAIEYLQKAYQIGIVTL